MPAGFASAIDLDDELPEPLPIVKIFDVARPVTGQEGQPLQTEPAGLMHDVVEKRPAADRQDRFGNLLRKHPEAGAAPADQTYSLCDNHLGPDIYSGEG